MKALTENNFCLILLSLALIGIVPTGSRVCAEAVYIIPPSADSGALLMYKSVHYSNETLAKPSCDPSMAPKIFVTPVRMLGGTRSPITPIAGVSTYAVDNGDGTWTVKGQVKTSGDSTIEDPQGIAMIVETYCCTNDLCN